MRILYTLLAVTLILAACSKPKEQTPAAPPATEDTTKQDPVFKDSVVKITGIDSIVTMPYFDSISIPITVSKDTGMALNVTLSISGLPMRVKAKFEQISGTPPFTTNLKLYTYMVGGDAFRDSLITIAITPAAGQTIKHQFKLHIDNKGGDPFLDFYNMHDKNWMGPTINYDPNSGQLYITNLFLGVHDSKTYYSLTDSVDVTKNMTLNELGFTRGYIFFFGWSTIKGRSGTDTANFRFGTTILTYYSYGNTNPDEFTLSFDVNKIGGGNSNELEFIYKGNLEFDY